MRMRFVFRPLIAAVVCLACGITVADGRTVGDVELPDTVVIEETTCSLNGIGTRKRFFISVYHGALYLNRPSSDAGTVIRSDQTKRIVLHFVYSEVSAEQLVDAWNEGFENNTGDARADLADQIRQFNGYFSEPVHKGDSIVLTYVPGTGTTVTVKGVTKGTIPGVQFMQAVFSIWFGPEPPSDDLKEDMLGR